MTHDLLDRIRREYEVPRDVIFALPQGDDCPSRPPRGWVTLYWEMFKNGLRLPLHPFVQRWMAFLGIAPHQMNPNLLRKVFSMFVLWKKHHNIEPSMNILRCCFGLRKSPKQAGFFYLQVLQGKLVENNPTSQKSWKDHWFFSTGCWEVVAGVGKPSALVARRFREKGGMVTFVVLGPAGFFFFFFFGADSVLYVLVAVDWERGELSEDEEG
ncbi:uncharacterized protein Pyn_05761 [Prunus yedoensis var. nudiflora]|uniref:Transposase (putative) gypsy type domain-containing protein n=1 Tax=Prunus yedoensis var. nudiflora TaxID=2094558 RepID=A0A314YW75_PRUYE|nr:uncharacterized protein Pyn_05761 [Prunus yedoensis var. nudiflora]